MAKLTFGPAATQKWRRQIRDSQAGVPLAIHSGLHRVTRFYQKLAESTKSYQILVESALFLPAYVTSHPHTAPPR